MAGRLLVVATPIGNLGDISPRAQQALAECALIAAEDTRHSGRLLQHLAISTPLCALHEHSSAAALTAIVERVAGGDDVALISDAGTPLISDPGFELVREVRARGLEVVSIPGSCAAVAALSIAGLPTDQFEFRGFPPAKAKLREAFFRHYAQRPATQVFYESSHRIGDSVAQLADCFGAERPALLARELTKLYEQSVGAQLGELAEELRSGAIVSKGEFVVVVGGWQGPATDDRVVQAERLLAELCQHLPSSKAAKIAASLTGLSKRQCYQIAERCKVE